MIEVIMVVFVLTMVFYVYSLHKRHELDSKTLKESFFDNLFDLKSEVKKIERKDVSLTDSIESFNNSIKLFTESIQKNTNLVNDAIKSINDKILKFSEDQEKLNTELTKKAEVVIEFNEMTKLFMDHAQQRAIRILEFNDLLSSFNQMINDVSQNASSLWIHDPNFKAFRINLEEMMKQIEYYQKDSMQSIQFLFGNEEEK